MGSYSIENITVLTILQFSSFTSADWLFPPYTEAPAAPAPNASRSCVDWITFYGFGEDTKKNRAMAKKRATAFDFNVSEFALIYAQVLVAFPIIGEHFGYQPLIHCMRVQNYTNPVSFQTIISTQKTCPEWIYSYNFRFDDYDNNNLLLADNRNKSEDSTISVWAAGYARFIKKKQEEYTISISDYCSGMGISDNYHMSFISYTGITKTCKEWIELSGYGDTVDANQLKFNNHDIRFFDFLNASTRRFIAHLRLYYAPEESSTGCLSWITSESDDDGPLIPEVFCNKKGYTENRQLKYNE